MNIDNREYLRQRLLLIAAGGFGGCVAKTATSPLERIRVLAQTGNSRGIGATATSILETEGWKGFWRGNATNCFRIFPAKGILFATNDFYKEFFRNSLNIRGRSDPTSLSFFSGSFAGMTASISTYPLDFARTRLAGVTGRRTGLFGILKEAIQDGGYRSLYRGCGPTILGAMPYEGIKFGVYGFVTNNYYTDDDKPSIMFLMSCGALAGMTAGLVVYPNDTVRKIMQISGSKGEHHGQKIYTSMIDCYKTTYRKGGIGRFYHGVTPYVLRCMPNAAIQFSVYESIKTLVLGS